MDNSYNYNMIMNCYSLIILGIISVSEVRLSERINLRDRLYRALLVVTILTLGADALGRLDGLSYASYPFLNAAGNFFLYSAGLFVPSLWFLYVHLHIYDSEARTMRLLPPLLGINLLNLLAVILSKFYGWYYYIDGGNIFHRGPVFWLPSAAAVGITLAAWVMTVRNSRRMERRVYRSLTLFSIPPLICVIFQNLLYGLSLTMHGVTLSLLVLFINVQNRSIYTDHLTGVGNRKQLEHYLQKKIAAKTASGRFAAIMLDLDDFKAINDTYGHFAGDRALEDVAALLRQCVRADDFIARYGGDEFVVISDVSSAAGLEAMVERIHKSIAVFNASNPALYRIRLSMGHAFYDYEAPTTKEEYLRRLDALMYESKQHKEPPSSGAS